MGMFDDLICKYPLPVKGANDLRFQTKDTPMQFMDLYEIREDGTLWHQDYDIEDRSDKTAPEGSLERLSRVNKRWEQLTDFIGEIRFYTFPKGDEALGTSEGWIEFSAYFTNGNLKHLRLVEYRDK